MKFESDTTTLFPWADVHRAFSAMRSLRIIVGEQEISGPFTMDWQADGDGSLTLTFPTPKPKAKPQSKAKRK